MKSAKLHEKEKERLEDLKSLNLLDTLPEKDYDNIVELAATICKVPIALISLVDKDRQWFKSKIGLEASQTSREVAFCSHAILQEHPFIIEDALSDERFFDNPLVTEGIQIRFYAGVPLISPKGYPLGTLCVIDTESQKLNEAQVRALQLLCAQLTRLLELRQNIANFQDVKERLLFKNKAIDSLKEGIVYQKSTGEIIDFNPAALDILGLTADQITGKTSMDPHWRAIKSDETDFPGDQHPAMLALKTGEPICDAEMGIRAEFKKTKWITINAVPIFTKDSILPSHVVTTFTDVSEKREQNRRLQKSKTDIEFLLNSLPHAISHWTHEGICTQVNSAFLRFYQKSSSEILGCRIQDIRGSEKIFQDAKNIDSVLSGKFVKFEKKMMNNMGTIRETMVHMIPNLQNEQLVDFLIVEVDVSELKQLERNRQDLELKLNNSSRMMALGEMASGIAHEINNPLAILKGKVGLLVKKLVKENIKTEVYEKDVETLDRTVNRINKIVRGLSMYSRKHNAEDSFDKADVKVIIEDTLSLCIEKFRISGVELITDNLQSITIDCRPAQISQVITNLLNNSFDAIQGYEKKWIKLELVKEEDFVHIYVKDCGPGIRKDIADKIMQPFFTTKEVGKGTGLGLSISSGIAEMHGGILKYIEGGNTCFCLSLPIHAVASGSNLKAA
jgi:PAS domain S-box-containing protein